MRPGRVGSRVARWSLVIAYSLLIWYQSSRPSVLPPEAGDGTDKLAHVAGYMLHSYLLARALECEAAGGLPAVAFVGSGMWGAIDEIHQAFVPFRSCQLGDWLADLLGALLGVVAASVLRGRWRSDDGGEVAVFRGNTPA